MTRLSLILGLRFSALERRRRKTGFEAAAALEEQLRRSLGRRLHSGTAQLLSAAVLELDLAALTGEREGWGASASALERVQALIREGSRSLAEATRQCQGGREGGLAAGLERLGLALSPGQVRLPADPPRLGRAPLQAALHLVRVCLEPLPPEERELCFLAVQPHPAGGLTWELTVDPEELPTGARQDLVRVRDWLQALGVGWAELETGFLLRFPGEALEASGGSEAARR